MCKGNREEMKYIRLTVTFKAPFGLLTCLVSIKNEYAVTTFKSLKHAKEFYANEKEGGADVRLVERSKAIIEKFEDKTKEEILKIIKAELKKVGGKFTVHKINKRIAG